jgi:type II secretory pathway pseudopilin PulG
MKIRGLEKRKNRGQVWIETVLYTLVGVAIIGILLAIAKPKIDSYRDRAIIEQTMESLNLIDEKITSVMNAPDNLRMVDLKISKGEFQVLTKKDVISWTIDSSYQYSEPGQEVRFGNVKILTEGLGPWKVTMKIDYNGMLNLTAKDSSDANNLKLESSPTPYSLAIQSFGSTNSLPGVKIYVTK